jgi:predicted restriction endonuclease
MSGERWTRGEYILTLDLYLNHPDIIEDESDPQIREVASLIGRTPGAVALRLANYRYLDPASTEGMSHVGKACKQIWEEYHDNERELAREANNLRKRLTDSTEAPPEHSESLENNSQIETGESTIGHAARHGQSDFRSSLLERYDSECLICDIQEPGLLIAGHILPWAEFDDERGDPANGILLCYTHHEAFDLGMFTLSEEYECIPRPDLEPTSEFLRRTIWERRGTRIEFPHEPPLREHLKRHNDRLYWWPVE